MAEIRDELFYKQKNGYDTMSSSASIWRITAAATWRF